MARVQTGLTKQLKAADDKLTLELREKAEGVSQVKKKREAIGVDLYSCQQALAKLQLQLEHTHERYAEFHDGRIQAEADLTQMSEAYKQRKGAKGASEERLKKTQKELDKIKVTLSQIDEFNEKVKSEILVTRRAAYGTEESMQKMEKKKKLQDTIIDGLNEQLRKAKEQIRLFDAQLLSQKEETINARETLNEAVREMEILAVEKREYLHKWKSSLIGMANRDAALQQANDALRQQSEEIQALDLQIKRYKQSIRIEHEKNEIKTELYNKAESEARFLENQKKGIEESSKKLNSKYLMLRSNLEQTDKELQISMTRQRDVKGKIENVHKKYEKLMQDKQKLDDTILENFSNRTTIEKGAQNVWKNTQKLKQEIHGKEIKMGEIQNEIARIKVDSLNTSAHNKELKQTLNAYDKELKEKDKLIEKYEVEIRQRHDKIEKKQIYIARLNRQYEHLTSNKQDENTGPLEATIKNLKKEIRNTAKDSGERQREWIKTQTELVGLVSSTSIQAEDVQELKSRKTILEQKRLRLSSAYEVAQKECKELRSSIKAMHTDLTKLNSLISKNAKQQQELANKNYAMETEFMNKLKDLEQESKESEGDIEEMKQRKEKIFDEVVEAEKQIMLWEKKIQLERETQEALDTEYGQPEIKGMKKEIHRMKNRLTKLKRQQEKMIQEMERTIAKRETIKLAHIGAGMGTKKSQGFTQQSMKKKIVQLKSSIQKNVHESKKLQGEISKQEESNEVLLEELEKQQNTYNQVEDEKSALCKEMEQGYFIKQIQLETILKQQQRAQNYQEAKEGSFRAPLNSVSLQNDLSIQEERYAKIKDAVGRLEDDHPKYRDWFLRIKDML